MTKIQDLQHAGADHPPAPNKEDLRDSERSSGGSKGEVAGPPKPATPRQDSMAKALATLQSLEAEHPLSSLPKPSSSGNIAEPGLRAADPPDHGKERLHNHASNWEAGILQVSSSSGSEEDQLDVVSLRQPSQPGAGEAIQRLKERRRSTTQEGRKIAAYPSPGEAATATAVQVNLQKQSNA